MHVTSSMASNKDSEQCVLTYLVTNKDSYDKGKTDTLYVKDKRDTTDVRVAVKH